MLLIKKVNPIKKNIANSIKKRNTTIIVIAQSLMYVMKDIMFYSYIKIVPITVVLW